MQTLWFERLDSTQRYLVDALKSGALHAPAAVVADEQEAGKGSRGNGWIGMRGNLFFSFALHRSELPDDLKLESASIYFSYLLKEVLEEAGSRLWLKWPNDFYVDEQKIGGTLTNLQGEILVCGIGINLLRAPDGFGTLDVAIERKPLLGAYFKKLEKKMLWKQIFSKYELEFDRSRAYSTHKPGSEISLETAQLLEDGSILSNGQRIFSLR